MISVLPAIAMVTMVRVRRPTPRAIGGLRGENHGPFGKRMVSLRPPDGPGRGRRRRGRIDGLDQQPVAFETSQRQHAPADAKMSCLVQVASRSSVAFPASGLVERGGVLLDVVGPDRKS